MLAELILGLKRHSGRRPECCPQVEILPAAAAERARPDIVRRRTWDEQVKAGLIVGGGFEYAFTKHFVGRGEYLYADYGSTTLSSKDRTRAEFRNEMHLVRVGASYRF